MSSYVIKNRGYITASKLKQFIKCEEVYKRVYVDEQDTSFIKESTALAKGTMVDIFVLTPVDFEKEYALPIGKSLVADLKEYCDRHDIEYDSNDKKGDLEKKVYGNRKVVTISERTMLAMIDLELSRQPLFDNQGKYETQVELECEYKGFKLRGTIDRLSVEKGLIRDLKTSKDIEQGFTGVSRFEYGLRTNDEYQYGLQLARYRLLCKIKYDKEFDCIIDAIKTTGNYASQFFKFDKDTIKNIVYNTIIPNLDRLIECHKNNDFSSTIERDDLLGSRYYPMLDCTIQKDFITLDM